MNKQKAGCMTCTDEWAYDTWLRTVAMQCVACRCSIASPACPVLLCCQVWLASQQPGIAGVILHSPLLSGVRVFNPTIRWGINSTPKLHQVIHYSDKSSASGSFVLACQIPQDLFSAYLPCALCQGLAAACAQFSSTIVQALVLHSESNMPTHQ